ncbi:hypothetical protein PM082_009491 [Marasmius tenuissimus]|nr:hypothetical protein PM082_009491 [Marasmius tenuissimus]
MMQREMAICLIRSCYRLTISSTLPEFKMRWPVFVSFTFLSLWNAGAQVVIGDIGPTLTVSQPVTVGWSRASFTEPLRFQLLYLATDSSATATQILAAGVTGEQDANGARRGTLTFAATAAGNIQLEAVKSVVEGLPATVTQTYTAMFNGGIRLFVASATRSTPIIAPSETFTTTSDLESPTASSFTLSSSTVLSTTLAGGETPQGTDTAVIRDHKGLIVDGVIVVVVLLSFLTLGFLYIRRRRRIQEAASIQHRMIIRRVEAARAHHDEGFGYRPWNEKISTSEAGPRLSTE